MLTSAPPRRSATCARPAASATTRPGLVAGVQRDRRSAPTVRREIDDVDLIAIGIGGDRRVPVGEDAQRAAADRGRRDGRGDRGAELRLERREEARPAVGIDAAADGAAGARCSGRWRRTAGWAGSGRRRRRCRSACPGRLSLGATGRDRDGEAAPRQWSQTSDRAGRIVMEFLLWGSSARKCRRSLRNWSRTRSVSGIVDITMQCDRRERSNDCATDYSPVGETESRG